MARLNKDYEKDFPGDEDFWGGGESIMDPDDFESEFGNDLDDDGPSCFPKELFGLLGTAILNKNPFAVIFNEDTDLKLLDLYGYKTKEVEVEGVFGKHTVAVKKSERFPRFKTYDDVKPYMTKIVLDQLNQDLMLKVMEWLINKFNK